MSSSLRPQGLQHTRLFYPSLSPGVYSNSCPWSQWCYLTVSSSVLSSFCLQSFPASESFPLCWIFASGGQSIGTSASASVLPINIQGWFPLGWTGLISVLSKGLKHQFFSVQPSLWSNSHVHTWLLEKPELWLDGPCWQSNIPAF